MERFKVMFWNTVVVDAQDMDEAEKKARDIVNEKLPKRVFSRDWIEDGIRIQRLKKGEEVEVF